MTLILRRCQDCDRVYGITHWPGPWLELDTTHGLCRSCHAKRMEEEAA